MSRTRRIVGFAAGGALLLVVGFAFARDLADVIVLRTHNAEGTRLPTRVWFIEDGGHLVVRGDEGRNWVARVRADPKADVLRPGRREDVRARIVTDAKETARLNRRFREKYGWLDRIATAHQSEPFVMVRLTSPWPRRPS